MTGLATITILSAAIPAISPAVEQTVGRLHFAVVHFPIALLLVAAVVEMWAAFRNRDSKIGPTCFVLGALAAAVSVGSGWLHGKAESSSGTNFTIHEWLGFSTAIVGAIGVVFILLKWWKPATFTAPYRVGALFAALLVAATGHFGGNMVHGDGYLTELLLKPAGTQLAEPTPTTQPTAALAMPIAFPKDGKIVFARDVQPILQNTCLDCHGPAKHKANLRLDTKEATHKGGTNGPSLVAGKSDQSLIIKHVLALDGKKRMPMGRDPLTEPQVKILKAWIDAGADWPATETLAVGEQKQHWAYVKPKRVEPPTVSDANWVRNPIDNFVMARLDKEGMKPAPEADRTTLIRRLSLDLLGLPPTPEEVDAFVNDTDPKAYDNLVSRMLASPHYGERWGRHWLDIARYADTNGYEKDNPRTIWPYRDWVISAINRDVTFDQFVIQQFAGDMLPGASADEKIATGFHRNTMFNEEGGIDAEEFRYKAVVDRVQTTSTALLGLTMHCAQCHNHKYDDISQKEYFQFFGLMNNTDEPEMNLPDASITAQRRTIQERVDTLRRELASKFPYRDESIKWEVVTPEIFATSKGSRLVLQPDNSLLSTGAKPEKDRYIIEADVDTTGVSAFRLEVLTDPSLPKNGPGRNENGNLVLSQFKLEQADAGEEDDVVKPRTRIKIDRAEADYAQPEFDVSKSIDDSIDKGWAIGNGADTNKSRTATFYTSEKLTGKRKLIFTLRQEFKNHTIGKFRLSIGRPPPPPATQPTPADREKFLVAKLAEWEAGVKAKSVDWEILDPIAYERKAGATITKLEDKSLLFTGDNYYREEYKLRYATTRPNISAIRVEVLPDEHQPKGGPGRDVNGGFLLSELTGIASSAKQPATTQPINFASVSADAAADSAPRAIDGKNDTHWTVGGGAVARHIVFKLKDKLEGFAGGTTLDLSIVQNYFQPENLGRVRISITSAPNAGEVSGVPADVEAIVLLPKDARSTAQKERLREYFLTITPYLAAQQAEIAAAKASMPNYTTTLVMEERKVPRVTRIHHRGEYLQPEGPIDAPAIPAVLPQLPKDAPKNRLALARWLVEPENPLVARVVMNRFWTLYFGRGIVNTIEDFGVMGEKPSHPELLDWLATEFVRENWSMKSMHRLIVTSATYRQSSKLTPEVEQRDPQNVLLSRGPRFRVESEIVRDIALASSGLLTEKIGGPSVFPPQPPGISELSYGPMTWTNSVGPDRYRRGMYTFLKRTAMYPGQTTFDGPTADVVCARRIRSNTPLQALTTLNDTVFVEASQAMALRVMEEGPKDNVGRAIEVFRLCVARKPDDTELRAIMDFYDTQLKRFKTDKTVDATAVALADPNKKPSGMDIPELAAWTTVARSVLNLDETVTKE